MGQENIPILELVTVYTDKLVKMITVLTALRALFIHVFLKSTFLNAIPKNRHR